MKEHRFCEVCGTKYKTCKSCEENYSKIYYTWRQHFCSPKCFMIGMSIEEGGGKMRVQFNGKTATLKEYDLDKGEFVLPDESILGVDDIEGFVLDNKEFKKVMAYKRPVTKAKKDAEIVE